ncbi:MAG TPA: hypothetical protein VGE52_06205, partial [Pirellulales bacterium]
AAFRVMIPAQGRSVKQLLDACFDRRRLLGYTVDVVPGDDGAPEKMSIRGFTFVKTTIELEEQDDLPAATFRANPSSDLDFSTAFDVLDAQVRRDARSSYSQVVVRGARLTSCWSCSSGTILVPGWSDDQAESYQAGASGESDYPADELEKLLRDSEFRKNDAILQPAFRQFVIAQDWNGKKGDNAVWPDMNQPEFDATLAAPFWRPGLTLDRELPLRVGVDYSETKIKDDEETSFNPDDREADYVAPMCLIPLPESETRYVLCEKAGSVKAGGAADAEEAEPPYTWSADVRMLHEDAGVDLRVENAPQHIICSAEFDQELDSDIEPEVDWNDFIFVLAGKSDQFVKVAWPKTPPPAAPEPSEDELKERGPDAPSIVDPEINSVLTIEMEDAECWYVVPDTVVGVKDGVPQKSTSGGFIRDDRPRMERLAKLAYGFYAVPRRAFLLTYRQISGLFTVGQMIGTVKSGEKTIDVGSVVTSVRWDLKQGLTIVSTDHAELDERSFS